MYIACVLRIVGFDWCLFLHRMFLFFLHREDKEYLVDDDGVIRSVENLRQLQNVKWVVLSLGGNASLGSNEKWGDEFWVKTRVQTNGRENQQGVGEWSWHVFKANWLSQSGCYYKKLCQLYFFCPGEVTLQDWLRDFTSLCVLPLWCWKVENVGRKQMFHCIYMIRLCTFYLIKKHGFRISFHAFPIIFAHIQLNNSNIPAILRSFRTLPPSKKKRQGSKPIKKNG